MYVTVGETREYNEGRREAMCLWTMEVLKELRKEAWAPFFRFGSILYEKMYGGELFEEPIWHLSGSDAPVQLFEG